MQPILSREVSDPAPFRKSRPVAEPAALGIHVALEASHDRVVVPHEMRIGCGRLQRTAIHAVEHLYRVVVAQIPALAVEEFEEPAALRMPAPPEVVGQLS